FNDYNVVAYKLDSLMHELNVLQELPEGFRQLPTMKGATRPRERTLADARSLLDSAASEGTLTPAQILVARIYLIADNDSASEIERQSEMLKELISTQPKSFTDYLGYDVFFEHKIYRPAVECFK